MSQLFATGFILVIGSVCIGYYIGSWLIGIGIFLLGYYLFMLKDLFD